MVGLAKKVFIADNIAVIVSPLFEKAATIPLDPVAAWMAALGYTAQLYFDFSGYSDMAIGLGLMFSIVLPVNFFSPYKATSIIEFWRRWHITLSAFLRDYLYIPLGGNRSGRYRRYLNLMTVMLLGGLWHGAAWTFVAWGALHGAYLLVNHLWRGTIGRKNPLPSLITGPLTFLCVVVAWVLFRSPDFQTAANVLAGLTTTDVQLPGMVAYLLHVAEAQPPSWLRFSDQAVGFVELVVGLTLIPCALLIAWVAPNTAQLFRLAPGKHDRAYILPRHGFAITCWTAVLIWLSLFSLIGAAPSEFLYFQF
jgi:D-alanyl-lipoteichoic acid acyltransferase DltB (MBOAT superfamily)